MMNPRIDCPQSIQGWILVSTPIAGFLFSMFVAVTAVAQANAIRVESPWTRATPPGASTGAGFLTAHNANAQADRLISASSAIAGRTELHEMAMEKDVMKMREVKSIPLAANGKLELKPGGYHLMLLQLKAPLKAGDKVPVTLQFEKAGAIKIELEVRAMGAGAGGHAGHGDHGGKKH
jgi:copper(I)-binding protein